MLFEFPKPAAFRIRFALYGASPHELEIKSPSDNQAERRRGTLETVVQPAHQNYRPKKRAGTRAIAMNISIGGAVMLWVGMLWPVLVSVAYFVVRRPSVSNPPALAFACIVVGYPAMVGLGMLLDVIERRTFDFGILPVLLSFLAPILTTHLIVGLSTQQRKEG